MLQGLPWGWEVKEDCIHRRRRVVLKEETFIADITVSQLYNALQAMVRYLVFEGLHSRLVELVAVDFAHTLAL